MTTAEVLPARLNPRPVMHEAHTRVLVVTDDDVDVTVQWHYQRGPSQPAHRFNCYECGRAERANGCVHTFAAALVLADELLGLDSTIPVPQVGAR